MVIINRDCPFRYQPPATVQQTSQVKYPEESTMISKGRQVLSGIVRLMRSSFLDVQTKLSLLFSNQFMKVQKH